MKNLRKRSLLGASVAILGYLSAPAHASLTPTGVSCSGQGTSMPSDPGYLACSGAWSGNNLNQSADVASQILSDWSLSLGAPLDITGGSGDATSGTLSLPAVQTGLFVISLKAGDAFSLYEFNGAAVAGGISSIAFDTLGVGFFSNGGKEHFGQGLSHADIYGSGSTPVPEPATLLLLGVGVAGLALGGRRKVDKA